MGAAVLGAEQGVIRRPDLGEDLRCSGSFVHALRVGDVGNDTTHRFYFEWNTPQGYPKSDRETTSERTGRWMGVSPAGEIYVRVSITRGGYLNLLLSEKSHTVHYGQVHYEPVSGGGADAGDEGGQEVVGEGCIGLGGDVDGG